MRLLAASGIAIGASIPTASTAPIRLRDGKQERDATHGEEGPPGEGVDDLLDRDVGNPGTDDECRGEREDSHIDRCDGGDREDHRQDENGDCVDHAQSFQDQIGETRTRIAAAAFCVKPTRAECEVRAAVRYREVSAFASSTPPLASFQITAASSSPVGKLP